MGVRRILTGALTAPLLLLSACGGGDDSIADPPLSSAPTSSEPTQTPQQESPEHFIRRWVEAEKVMENTGKTDAYLAISKGCKACTKLANEVRGFYAAGGYVRWGGWRILSIESSDSRGAPRTYTVNINSAPTVYKETSSGTVKHLAGGRSVELLTVRRVGGEWHMTNTVEQAS